jgi:2-methylisocitrate lyase-like PEP mutase family enzyme
MTTLLREKMKSRAKSGETVTAIGAYDAFSGLLVERAGFDSVYIGSYATEAAMLGQPDLAMMSKNDRLLIARNTVKAVNIPVIVDAEEGYGNALNVMDTVRDFEAAGVAAIHLDDEQLPSKCPFVPGIPRNQLISTDEMCGKIQAALQARTDPDFLIIVRSDVIGTVPREQYYQQNLMEQVVLRSNAYAEAGADAIFIMALNEEELDYFAQKIKAPLVGIFATVEPIPISAFAKAGYQITIGSLVGIYAAAKGLVNAYAELKRTGDWNAITHLMVNDDEFFEILNIKQYQPKYKEFKIS